MTKNEEICFKITTIQSYQILTNNQMLILCPSYFITTVFGLQGFREWEGRCQTQFLVNRNYRKSHNTPLKCYKICKNGEKLFQIKTF